METPRANGPAGMGQYVELGEMEGSGNGGRRELHRYELLLKVLMVSVVASVKSVAGERRDEHN